MVFYDMKPSVLEAVGNGAYLYRFNIEEVDAPANAPQEEAAEPRKQWQCDEVTVWPPISSNKITEVVIGSKWDKDHEQKLINEYNAAQLGLYGAKTSDEAKAKIANYKTFLEERAAIKAQIDADCEELNIK